MEEESFIRALKSRDNSSFMKMVDLYKNKIVSLCYSYTNDYYEAEDLSQEIFISIYKNIVKFKGECSLSTYIYKISVSRCLDYVRKRKIKQVFGGILNIQKSKHEDIDEKNFIRECIIRLPEKLKTPLILYFYIGLTQREISAILGITEKNVEGRIYRAKKQLKKVLESEANVKCAKSLII